MLLGRRRFGNDGGRGARRRRLGLSVVGPRGRGRTRSDRAARRDVRVDRRGRSFRAGVGRGVSRTPAWTMSSALHGSPQRHRRRDRIVFDEPGRRLWQRTAENPRPSLVGDEADQAKTDGSDQAEDPNGRAAQADEHVVADQRRRGDRPRNRLSKLGRHLYVHRRSSLDHKGVAVKFPLLPRRYVESLYRSVPTPTERRPTSSVIVPSRSVRRVGT